MVSTFSKFLALARALALAVARARLTACETSAPAAARESTW